MILPGSKYSLTVAGFLCAAVGWLSARPRNVPRLEGPITVGASAMVSDGMLTPNVLVTVDDSLIASVKQVEPDQLRSLADVYLPEVTLLPGLIDAHSHITEAFEPDTVAL